MIKKAKNVIVEDRTAMVKQPRQEVILNSPAEMIRIAVSEKADLAQLKELLALQKEWEENEARKLFAVSFASAQKKVEVVIKTKINQQTHSKYADLSDIIESVKPVYTQEGFAVIFYEGVSPRLEEIRICADILHRAGHKETYFFDVPLDGVGIKGNANMTKIHAKASSTSYGRRYLMCMIWNIPTGDDNDGNGAKQQTVERPKPQSTVTPATKPQPKEQPMANGINTQEEKSPVKENIKKFSPPTEIEDAKFVNPAPEENQEETLENKQVEQGIMTQDILSEIISKAIKNNYGPDDIKKQFTSLGYTLKNKLTKSFFIEEIEPLVSMHDASTILDIVSSPKKSKPEIENDTQE